ncbi:MAG: cation-translocating P-type ATPase [Spirochaetales bacterium]|nr:cation-translocating P-type ATPase [Spirochaetales bacterium]
MNIEKNSKEYRVSFYVKGMTCSNCAAKVEKSIKKLDNIDFASVNPVDGSAYVVASQEISYDSLATQVRKVGYTPLREASDSNSVEKEFKKVRGLLVFSLGLTLPLMILMVVHMSGVHFKGFAIIELVVASLVLGIAGFRLFKSAFIAAIHFHSNMDTLVALGAFVSWLTAVLSMAGLGIVSFGSISAMLVAFHITGKYIETRLKYKAIKKLQSLDSLLPEFGYVELEGGQVVKLPFDKIKKGSIVQVRAGNLIPGDGRVVEGVSLVDQSMISGESVPVKREVGDLVIGGTIALSGFLRVEIEKNSDESYFKEMSKLISQAQASSVPIQAAADKIARYFIPIVIFLALFSSAMWGIFSEQLRPLLESVENFLPWVDPGMDALSQALFVFTAVIVIACPCALSLAAPMAIIVSASSAATRGFIVKDGEALAKAGKINTLVLDKTGTITMGRPSVVYTNLSGGELEMAGRLASKSLHPVSNAIKSFVEESLTISDASFYNIEEISGLGIKASDKGIELLLKKPSDYGGYSSYTKDGCSISEFFINGEKIGFFAVKDKIRDEVITTLRSLKAMGIEAIMATGDNREVANQVAASVGISKVYAQVRPEEKLKIVEKLRASGKVVGMVGDGINDSAALKSADVGFSLSDSSNLSVEAADIVISADKFSRIREAIILSKITYSKIKINLFSAFFYNILALPLASLSLLHPVIAELAMLLSSINVTGNSILIGKKFRKKLK